MMDNRVIKSSHMKDDLTAFVGDAPFGCKTVGTYFMAVQANDQVKVVTNIKSVSSGMVLEGWLVDVDSDYKLRIGKANHNGKLFSSQPMANPVFMVPILLTEGDQ